MTNRITELLKAKTDHPDTEAVEARKRRWLGAIDGLFGQLDEWLRDAIINQTINQPVRRGIVITEQGIGLYQTAEYLFTVGSISVKFTPKATYVLGAHGRVDASSSIGRSTSLVLIENSWRIVDPKTRQTSDLNEQSFLDLLQFLLSR